MFSKMRCSMKASEDRDELSEQLGPTLLIYLLLPLCVRIERMGQRCCLHFISGFSLVFPSSCIFSLLLPFFFLFKFKFNLIMMWLTIKENHKIWNYCYGFSLQAGCMCVIVANHFLCVIWLTMRLKVRKDKKEVMEVHCERICLIEISYCDS